MDFPKLLHSPAPWIVGILNVTPDSFSDGGKDADTETAIERGRELLRDGAHMLDIGGESTRPGSQAISAEEELSRIEPVVAALARNCVLSIDTYHAATAKRCLELGAKVINDVSALRAEQEMPQVLRESKAAVILMHSKEQGTFPHASNSERHYDDVVAEVADFLLSRVAVATKAGIAAENIILDPGMGKFLSHDPQYSWELIRRFDDLQKLLAPFPLLIGVSRKGFLGGALTERDPISQFVELDAVRKGARFIRTHHVAQARHFLDVGMRLNNLC